MTRKVSMRKWYNFLIAPAKQARLVFIGLAVGLATLIGLFAYELAIFSELVQHLAEQSALTDQVRTEVANAVTASWVVFGITSFCFTIGIFVALVVGTHRIYGPLVAIQRHLRSLLEGDYQARINLRTKDEMKEVAALLNQLSEKLQNDSEERN